MKISERIEYWLDIADYDIETSHHMQKSHRYLYTVFMCQQAIEKILKALHLQKFSKEAPASHNLVYLQSLLDLNLSQTQLQLLANLTVYYIEGRYLSYKKRLSSLIDIEKSSKILKRSQEVYQCLRSKIRLRKS